LRRDGSRPISDKEDDATESDEWVEIGALPGGRNLLVLPMPLRVDEEEFWWPSGRLRLLPPPLSTRCNAMTLTVRKDPEEETPEARLERGRGWGGRIIEPLSACTRAVAAAVEDGGGVVYWGSE